MSMTARTGDRRAAAVRLGARYAAGLTYAHITGAAAVSLVVFSLSRNTIGDARNLLAERNLIALCVLAPMSATVGAVAGILNMLPA